MVCCAGRAKGRSKSCFPPPHEKAGFLSCVDNPCFVHIGFTVREALHPFPWYLFHNLQIHVIGWVFFLFIMSFPEFSCVQLYLIVVIDSSTQDDINLFLGDGAPGEAAGVGLSPSHLPSAT